MNNQGNVTSYLSGSFYRNTNYRNRLTESSERRETTHESNTNYRNRLTESSERRETTHESTIHLLLL
jgi:hypothetical protein